MFNFDLNLLLIFEALMEQRNVTVAAYSLNLTQPTLSHALSRLRKMCDDPLFVRTSAGMQPTAFAESIAGPVGEALNLIRKAITQRTHFDPASDARTFKLVLTDIGAVTFLPKLVQHLMQTAPLVRLETSQLTQDRYKEALETGEVELAIGVLPPIVAGFYQQKIFAQKFVCLSRIGHPRIDDRLTLEGYLAEEHVRVSVPGRRQSVIDHALSAAGHRRNVRVEVPQYLAIVPLLTSTDLVATVPERVVDAMGRSDILRVNPLPIASPVIDVVQFWHEKSNGDPGLTWLRATIIELFGG